MKFEKFELMIYRVFGLTVLVLHLAKFIKFEISNW